MPAGSNDRVVRGSVRKANELHEPSQHGIAPSHAHDTEGGDVTSIPEDDAKADADAGIHPHDACDVRERYAQQLLIRMRAQGPPPSTRVKEQHLAARYHKAHEISGITSERCLSEALPHRALVYNAAHSFNRFS